MELLRLVHGSHLYGTAHENSDLDTYAVYSGKGKSKQTITGDDDVIVHSLDSFLIQASKGVPQALEAMFAPQEAVLHSEIEYLRSRFVASGGETIDRYCRTMYNFSLGDYKQRRHALRLAYNLRDLIEYGRFNPRMKFSRTMEIKSVLAMPDEFYRGYIELVAGIKIFEDKE